VSLSHKIFLLEDDLSLNETLVDFFEESGYIVTSEIDGLEAESTLYEKKFDLILLDVNVLNLNGFEVLHSIRESGVKTPVVFITARDNIEDIEKGFGYGAEDYIKKPFSLKELKIRVEAILKRYNKESSVIQITPECRFNRESGELISKGITHKLSNKEAKLLELFLLHPNEILSHEVIFNQVWEYDETPSDSSLRTYIKNLRKLLPKESIESIKKRGYRYIGGE
jgi:two-component system OmpR family response regulator